MSFRSTVRQYGLSVVCCLVLATSAQAKDKVLTIDSSPPGATLEINGRSVGKTPYSVKVDEAFFNGTRWVWGVKHLLREQVHIRLLMDGYLPIERDIARGPFHWVANNGVYHGDYWLLTTTQYRIDLQKQNFIAKVMYIDPSLDLALVRVEGDRFPHLSLADLSTVQPGSSVVAIGTPSKGLQNSLTRGVVSAVGPMPKEPGTWIQTDTAINPGNSGGPLLNSAGDVIGITTQKEFLSADGRPLQGIGFALSTHDLLSILKKFDGTITPISHSPAQAQPATGKLTISSDVSGAEVFVDGDFVGNAPCLLKLAVGKHQISVKSSATSWERTVTVMDGSELTISAHLASAR